MSIPPALTHQLAKWRREGFGLWVCSFVVIGYDETFVIYLPGKHNQKFAEGLAQLKIAVALKVSPDDVILAEMKKEGP